jgi:hypothetical protein
MAWVSDLILGTAVDGYTGCARAIQGLDVTDALSEIRAKNPGKALPMDIVIKRSVP